MRKNSRKSILFALCACVLFGSVSALGGCAKRVPISHVVPPVECAHEHCRQVVTVEPTCTESGASETVCGDCGATVSRTVVEALGHDYDDDWTVSVLPKTDAAGERIRVCSRDDRHFVVEPVPMLSAQGYTVTAVAPTCANLGTTTYASDVYGAFTVYRQAQEHDYSAAQIDGKCVECGKKISSLNLGFTLNADGDGYIVNKTNRYDDADLVIPAEYNGLPVTEIASEGFAEWRWIVSVTIPYSIKKIGAGAFSQMSGLKKVYYNAVSCDDSDGRNWTFYPAADGSSAPIELIVGSMVEHIPARLFFPLATEPTTKAALSKIMFENGSRLKSIGDYAFYRTAVSEIVLPDSVETIGDHAFYGTALSELNLGRGVKSLGANAFGACESLRSVTFDRSILSIGDDCFNYCVKLESARLGSTRLRSLGADAFKNCYELSAVTFPTTLTEVGDGAFYDCKQLLKAIFDGELMTIGNSAFYGCDKLSEAVVSSNVVYIGNGAFENCSALAVIDYRARSASDLVAGNRVFAGAGGENGISVIIRSGVARVPARLFFSTSDVSENIGISLLTIEKGVTAVGANAFNGCTVDSAVYLGSDREWAAVDTASGNDALDGITTRIKE